MAVRKVESSKNPWQVDWTDGAGARRRKRFRTKRQAEDYHLEVTQQVRSGDWVDPSLAQKMTVGELYEKWIERIRTMGARGGKPAKPKTIHNYEQAWSKHIAPRWEYVVMSQVQYHAISEWSNSLDTGDSNRETVSKIFGRILSEGVRLGVISRNPAKDRLGNADYVRRATKKKKHVYLTVKQLMALVEAMPTDQDKAMVLVGGLSGLRWGEVTALQWGDIDLQKGLIHVQRAYSDVGGKLVLGTTKGGSDRFVPLHSRTAEALLAGEPERLEGVRVFNSTRGHPIRNGRWTPGVLVATLARLHAEETGDKSSLPPIETRFHDLRHTAVSLAISAGENIKVIQRIAGHSTATLTLDTYAGLFESDLLESRVRLDGFIDAALSG